MKKKLRNLMLIASFFLITACAKVEEPSDQEDSEEIVEKSDEMKNPFILKVDRSYLSGKNEEAAEVYIIDPSNNEVYVEGLGKDLTEEELEAMEDMSAEEIDDFLGLDEVEEPIHEINFFERTEDSIVLEYDDEKIAFTGLSETIFEDEAGIRYYLEENTTIADYEESLQGN